MTVTVKSTFYVLCHVLCSRQFFYLFWCYSVLLLFSFESLVLVTANANYQYQLSMSMSLSLSLSPSPSPSPSLVSVSLSFDIAHSSSPHRLQPLVAIRTSHGVFERCVFDRGISAQPAQLATVAVVQKLDSARQGAPGFIRVPYM